MWTKYCGTVAKAGGKQRKQTSSWCHGSLLSTRKIPVQYAWTPRAGVWWRGLYAFFVVWAQLSLMLVTNTAQCGEHYHRFPLSRAGLVLALHIPDTTASLGESRTAWRPQFRGPGGKGLPYTERPLPVEFGPDKNLLWRTTIPSGVSSPCIWGDRIFLSGFDEEAQKLNSLCLSRKTGEILWTQPVPATAIEQVYSISSPAACTPVTDGTRVCFYYGSYGLLSYDLLGNEIWKLPLPPPRNTYGVSSSPIIVDDTLYVNHQGRAAALLALDKLNGHIRWKADRSMHRYGWSTPVLWEHERGREILVLGGDFKRNQRLVAYDLATGKENWWVDGLPPCGKSTPVVGGGLLYLAAPDLIANEDDEQEPEVQARYAKNAATVMAVSPGGIGQVNDSKIVWHQKRGTPGVPSPLYVGGRLYTFKNGSLGFVRNAATGQLLDSGRIGPGGFYYSSPIAGDGKVFVASSEGIVSVIGIGDQLKVLAQNGLGETIMATPAIAEDVLFVRANTTLYAFRDSRTD